MLVGIGAKPKRLLIKLQSRGKPVRLESRLSRLYGFLGSLPAEKLEFRPLRGEVSGLCAFRAIVLRYAWPRYACQCVAESIRGPRSLCEWAAMKRALNA